MRHIIRCTVCGEVRNVNGQRQIDAFREAHLHGKGILASNHLELDGGIVEVSRARALRNEPLWIAHVTGYGLTVEGRTEQEAIESAKRYLRNPEQFTIRVERIDR